MPNERAIFELVGRSLFEGLAWSGGIGAIVFSSSWLDWPTTPGGFFSVDYASRWTGACGGWTKAMVAYHTLGDLLTWTAYVCIAVIVIRLHPKMNRLPSSNITVPLIMLVFGTCGGVHLLNGFANFVPCYRLVAAFKMLSGIIGLIGSVFIAHNLVVVSGIVKTELKRLRELEERLKERRNV